MQSCLPQHEDSYNKSRVATALQCRLCSARADDSAPAVVQQQVVLQPGIVALRPQVFRLARR